MLKTLIVEKNEGFRDSLIKFLGEQFSTMAFEMASTGKEALEKFPLFCPQLVFVDIHLPGGNGLQLARRIREKNAGTVIVMLADQDGPEYRLAANKVGANHFVSKGGASVDALIGLVGAIVE
ncbi:MAG: response regulator [Deltaproteobacteria bacterium]|nr:response regulator [Deltaproteobacteria bacterium]